jgi:hypothetical protein
MSACDSYDSRALVRHWLACAQYDFALVEQMPAEAEVIDCTGMNVAFIATPDPLSYTRLCAHLVASISANDLARTFDTLYFVIMPDAATGGLRAHSRLFLTRAAPLARERL